jgi:hypothetical protein
MLGCCARVRTLQVCGSICDVWDFGWRVVCQPADEEQEIERHTVCMKNEARRYGVEMARLQYAGHFTGSFSMRCQSGSATSSCVVSHVCA